MCFRANTAYWTTVLIFCFPFGQVYYISELYYHPDTTCLFGHLGHISVTKEKSTFSPKDWSCWTISHFKSINPVIPKQFSNLRHLSCKRQNTYLKFLKNAISKHNFWNSTRKLTNESAGFGNIAQWERRLRP